MGTMITLANTSYALSDSAVEALEKIMIVEDVSFEEAAEKALRFMYSTQEVNSLAGLARVWKTKPSEAIERAIKRYGMKPADKEITQTGHSMDAVKKAVLETGQFYLDDGGISEAVYSFLGTDEGLEFLKKHGLDYEQDRAYGNGSYRSVYRKHRFEDSK